MIRWISTLLPSLVLAVLLAGACGGGDGEDGDVPLPAAEDVLARLVARVDELQRTRPPWSARAAHRLASVRLAANYLDQQRRQKREEQRAKPATGAPANDPSGLTTKLEDYQKLDVGISLAYKDSYQIFLNVYNLLGQDIENLDDVYTVLDGEPILKGGIRCRW